MSYYGDIRLGDTLDIAFSTVGTTGAPTTLAGSPVISAYVGNSTTQITAGITLSVDFDGVTGLHNVRVVASSGNGYATTTNVRLVITTGTVGGTSVVGYVIGSFSIEARSALMPTTAARTLDVSATGEAGLDWANVGSPTTTVGLTGTTIATSQVVASVSGAVGSVTGLTVAHLDAAVSSRMASYTQPTGFLAATFPGTVASTTNITAASGCTLSATGSAAFTESYRTDGSTGTLAQLLYEIVAHLGESSITSTTKTIKKLDGSTTAATFTLNDATTPTSITRAT